MWSVAVMFMSMSCVLAGLHAGVACSCNTDVAMIFSTVKTALYTLLPGYCQNLNVSCLAGYQVPQELLRLLSQEPRVKRWFTDELKVTDLHNGAPAVVQLHANPVTASTSVAQYLKGKFNNPEAYPDAVVLASQQETLVHKLVVASTCPVLAKH